MLAKAALFVAGTELMPRLLLLTHKCAGQDAARSSSSQRVAPETSCFSTSHLGARQKCQTH